MRQIAVCNYSVSRKGHLVCDFREGPYCYFKSRAEGFMSERRHVKRSHLGDHNCNWNEDQRKVVTPCAATRPS